MNNSKTTQSKTFQLRDALLGEMDEVAQVIETAYAEYALLTPKVVWEDYSHDLVDVRSRLDVSELIVAVGSGSTGSPRTESGDVILGTVTFYPDGSRSLEKWPGGWAGIRILATRPEHRGQGVGKALMDECIRRSRMLGVKTIGIHTSKHMAVARKMYERMGFVRIPEFDFAPAPDVVVIVYRLDI